MRNSLAATLLRCLAAVLAVGAALAVTNLLLSVVSTAGYIFFYIAVVAVAWSHSSANPSCDIAEQTAEKSASL